ncbi:MAG: DUF2971 domain-containing protein [Bacillota bacterium]
METEKFDYLTYIAFLASDMPQEAILYRSSFSPKYVYKFYSLYKDDAIINNSKIKTLRDNKIWFCKALNQNDPYEFQGMYLDDDRLASLGIPEGIKILCSSALKTLDENFAVASFTTRMHDNMPMWAYYANGFQGYCVKYSVLPECLIFNVMYEPEKIPLYELVWDAVQLALINGNSNSTSRELQSAIAILQEKHFIKHKSWEHEQEYRMIERLAQSTDMGCSVSCSEIYLKAEEIFAGVRCSDIILSD